jgi:ABC-2 type transport system permease protein
MVDNNEQNIKQNKKETHLTTKDKIKLFFQKIGGYTIAAFIDFKRSPMTIFFALAYPIIITLLFGAIFSGDDITMSYTLYLQSEGDLGYTMGPMTFNFTNDFITIMESIPNSENDSLVNVNCVSMNTTAGTTIDLGTHLEQVDGYIGIILPFNFTAETLTSPEQVILTIVRDENSASAKTVTQIIQEVMHSINLQANTILNPGDPAIDHFGIDTVNIFLEEEIPYFAFILPGVIAVTIMNSASIGTVQRYAYYRQQGFFRKLATTPMTKGEYLISETLWQFILGVFTFVAAVLVSWLVFRVPLGDFGWILTILDWKILLILPISAISFVGLALVISRFVKNPDSAAGASNLLTFPMMFLSSAFFDVSTIPGLNVISKMIPLTYIVDALRSSMVTNQANIAWINIGISAAVAAVIMTIGILLTKIRHE